jgi:hypothetical protein
MLYTIYRSKKHKQKQKYMSAPKSKELTRNEKISAILQNFKTFPWHNGLETLDYSLPLEQLMVLYNKMKDALDNFEFQVGDRVVKLGYRQNKGTIVFIHAWSISHDPEIASRSWGDVSVIWDGEESYEKRSGSNRNICFNSKEVNSTVIVKA